MRLSIQVILLIFSFAWIGSGCHGSKSAKKNPLAFAHQDSWQITGRVANEGYNGGEIYALGADGTRYRSRISPDNNFALELPGSASYAVYFIAPSTFDRADLGFNSDSTMRAKGPTIKAGSFAALHFEESPDIGMRDTLRLPKVLLNRILSLGEIDIINEQAFPTINPATKLDNDNDGLNDFADLDDQNDGLSDATQKKAIEIIEICHLSNEGKPATVNVSLASLFNHFDHGDVMGACQIINTKENTGPTPSLIASENAPSGSVPNTISGNNNPLFTSPSKTPLSHRPPQRKPPTQNHEKHDDVSDEDRESNGDHEQDDDTLGGDESVDEPKNTAEDDDAHNADRDRNHERKKSRRHRDKPSDDRE